VQLEVDLASVVAATSNAATEALAPPPAPPFPWLLLLAALIFVLAALGLRRLDAAEQQIDD